MEIDSMNILRYYIVCGILRLLWFLGVLGFAITLLLILKTPFVLLSVGLIFLKPYEVLVHRRINDLEDNANGK